MVTPPTQHRKAPSNARPLSTAIQKLHVKPVACIICHSRKVKCPGGSPCAKCTRAGKECKYPTRDRQLKLSQSYIEQLLKENEQLREGVAATPTAVDNATQEVREVPPVTQNVTQDTAQNPLLGDRPWFIPVASLEMPIHIDLAADAAFATRFRQTLSGKDIKHIPRMNFVSDDVISALSDLDCPWPAPARARFLVKVALNTVCRFFHMVRRSQVSRCLEAAISAQGNTGRLATSKLFVLFALGELYSTKVAPPDGSFPGLLYFAHARRNVTVPAERPQLDTMEITLLLSLYSYNLNRRHSAHLFADSAIRLGIVMGMHLNIPESLLRDRAAREHRNRIWWTAYTFDRTWSSKLGHPVSVHDDDFDVDPPSADGLADDEDFGDHEYVLQNIELARLTGRIVPLLYGRRKQTKAFSQRVQQALTELTKWVENLPSHLQLNRGDNERMISSNMVYLHLTFNQCVIMVTRPILLHVFASTEKTRTNQGTNTSPPISEGARKIAQTCIQCARHSFRLLSESWIEGAFAIFDYFHTQYLFSAATILAISALSDTRPENSDADEFETACQILSQLGQIGDDNRNGFNRAYIAAASRAARFKLPVEQFSRSG
ncbi:Alternative oxidase [Venturia nashicola]|uniref:Alternative oxidase n=1 Tax=Venturia nashicola TaxID=86259 RepID=A0A4Z1PA71_9PEZI|nr:Alternative oxidase [Venturia nashicola]